MKRNYFLGLLLLITSQAQALPVDWHGVFGVDSTLIDNFRRIEKTTDDSNLGNAGNMGTQEVPLATGNHANSSFQSYIFRLNPVILVNDAATVKAEFSSGYGRGGRLGDNSTQSLEPGFGNTLYSMNFSDDDKSLLINKLYMELYSDTATYQIGRHSFHYGLGAVFHNGEGTWDRHSLVRDGLTMNLKLGNFKISPYWAKIGSLGSLTRATKIKEYGAALTYDNVSKNLGFGILFAKKQNSSFNTELTAGTSQNLPDPSTGNYNSYTSLGKTNVKILDLFFKKGFGNFNFALEIPILSGNIGNLFQENTKYKAKAFLFESNYQLSKRWSLGLDAGKVKGDDGNQANFEAMYLNPNYQIANLLFKYNMRAISNPDGANSRSLYDSYVNNVNYIKLSGTYASEKWTFNTAFIYAQAEQVAKAGNLAFNHMTNKSFTADFNQENDMGMELDLNLDYKWNSEVSIGSSLGYLFTGDYFGYTNTATPNSVKDSFVAQIRSAVHF